MKLNIANPITGCQQVVDIEDEKKIRIFFDKRIAAEVPVDELGKQFEGYVMKITGGFDKQGFPMKQGVLVPHRVRLLMVKGTPGFRGFAARDGERLRKSVRGCIVGPDISILNLVIVKKGEGELPGLTDKTLPLRLGPKRASKIRKMFNLTKKDDVRKVVVRRELPLKPGQKRPTTKAAKIQRLVTPVTLQRKRRRRALLAHRVLKAKNEAEEYKKLIALRRKEGKEKRQALIEKKRAKAKPKAIQ